MENVSFLKEILTTDHEYWVVARREDVRLYGQDKRMEDSIWFICVPRLNFARPYNEETLLLKDIERLRGAEVENISLTHDYAPFQYGVSMYNIYRGYPVKNPGKDFIVKALAINSTDLWDYKDLCQGLALDSTRSPKNEVI